MPDGPIVLVSNKHARAVRLTAVGQSGEAAQGKGLLALTHCVALFSRRSEPTVVKWKKSARLFSSSISIAAPRTCRMRFSPGRHNTTPSRGPRRSARVQLGPRAKAVLFSGTVRAHNAASAPIGALTCAARRAFLPAAKTTGRRRLAWNCPHGNALVVEHLLQGLGSPLPHLRRDWAHPCHICAGTGRVPSVSMRA